MTRADALMITGLLLSGCSATSLDDRGADSGPDALPDTEAGPTDATLADVEPDSESPKPPLDCSVMEGGPKMVAVSAPGGTTYCIDATEVTQVQYALFLQNTTGATPSRSAIGRENAYVAW